MASSDVQSKIGVDDISFAIGGTAAAETFVRLTSTGGELEQEKIDASHLKFRTIAKSIDDLVDGGHDVSISPLNVEIAGTLIVGTTATINGMSSAGFVKNTAAGLLSGGNALEAADLTAAIMPSAINAAKIADGSVSNTEFQYINTLTSNVQTQIDNIVAGELPATLYALIQDQKAQGTNGGTFTSGAWRTRDLNTEVIDSDNIVTIASNQFTLQAGTYRIRVEAPADAAVAAHRAKLYNVTDASDVSGCLGRQSYQSNANYGFPPAVVIGQFTIAGAKVFEIKHYGTVTVTNYGFGRAMNIAGYGEVYTQIELWKVA